MKHYLITVLVLLVASSSIASADGSQERRSLLAGWIAQTNVEIAREQSLIDMRNHFTDHDIEMANQDVRRLEDAKTDLERDLSVARSRHDEQGVERLTVRIDVVAGEIASKQGRVSSLEAESQGNRASLERSLSERSGYEAEVEAIDATPR